MVIAFIQTFMKQVLVGVSLCAFFFLTGCSQSSEKLLAAANKYHEKKQYQEASILYQKAIAKDKLNAQAYYREGLNLLDDHKISEAVQYLRRAVDLQPGNVDAATKLAEIYLAAYQSDPKKYESLLPDVRELDNKILAKDGNSFSGLRIKAMVTMAEGKVEDSLPIFARANAIKPYSRELIGWYADALQKSQKSQESVALVNDMLAHDKTWSAGYQLLFLYYGRIGDKEKAEEVLRDNAKNDPTNETAITNYANFLAASKRIPEAETVIRQTLSDPKSFPKAHMMVGDFYVRTSQFDKATAEYETGVKGNSADAVTYKERLVALQAYRNHPAEAAKMAKELADEHPKDPSVNEMYASVLLQTGQRADAAKSLESLKGLVAKNPNDPVLHLDLARAYFSVGEKDKALNEALEAVHSELKSQTPRAGVLIPANTVAARIYEDRGQHSKAMELADTVLSSQPNNPDALLIRDRALIGTDQKDKAQPELENLVKQYPKLFDAHLQLASLYLAQKQFDKARAEYEVLNSATPPDIRGFIGIQTIKMYTGKGEDAIQVMQDLVDKNPTVLPYRYELANFQSALAGQDWATNQIRSKELLQKAADNYKEILKTTANSSEVWLRLGVMQRQLLQYDTALASFEQAGNADPKNVAAFLNQALVCEALNRKKEASDAYNKVLAIDPDNPLVLNNLAYMTADTGGNLDQALTYAERAKKRAPDSPDVSDTLGFVYYKKEIYPEALRIFKQLAQEHPQSSTFHLHFAMALNKQGDKQGARDEAQKALQSAATPDEKNKVTSFVSQIG
jgi:tetratricopeptide (TPR) repeat protein